MNISTRDYFAASADVTWMNNATLQEISFKTGVSVPPGNPNSQQIIKFKIRAEIAWRWRYSDFMLDGFEIDESRVNNPRTK